MLIEEYKQQAEKTAEYPTDKGDIGFLYTIEGLCGEIGEFVDEVKKITRDKPEDMTVTDVIEENKTEFFVEMGDALWYWSGVTREAGIEFGEEELGSYDDSISIEAMEGSRDTEYNPLLHNIAEAMYSTSSNIYSRTTREMSVKDDSFKILSGIDMYTLTCDLIYILSMMNSVCLMFDVEIERVAEANLDKLFDRKEEGDIHGRSIIE